MSYLRKLEKFIEKNIHKEEKGVSQAQVSEVKNRIKQIRFSDGRTGYYVTEYTGGGITVYLVCLEDPDYAQVEKEYRKDSHESNRT